MRLSDKVYIASIALFFIFSAHLTSAVLKTPFNQEPEDWENFLPKLQNLINHTTPISTHPHPPPINAAVDVSSLDIPDKYDLLSPEGGHLIRIEFIIHSVDFKQITDREDRNAKTQTNILCTLSTGENQLLSISKEQEEQWIKIIQDFPKYGGIYNSVLFCKSIHQDTVCREEYDFRFPGEIAKLQAAITRLGMQMCRNNQHSCTIDHLISFQKVRDESNYTDDLKKFYRWHREKLSELLLSAVSNNQHVDQLVRYHGAILFCLGCGSGNDLESATSTLQTNGIDVQSIGIEIRPELVEKGLKQFPNYKFIQGNALNSAELILKEKSSRDIGSEIPTLIMAEGLLTRQVLRGPYESLQVLQELVQEGVADIVVIGGLASLLVNGEIATAAGWKSTTIMLYPDVILQNKSRKHDILIVLEKKMLEQQMEDIYSRSQRRSRSRAFTTLDLSMFGLPLSAIQHFLQKQEIQTIKQIDLSWSYLKKSEINQMLTLLSAFPTLTHITTSGFEPWYELFSEKAKALNQFILLKRTDNKYKHELPSFDPHTARLFGQYDGLPNRSVFKPTQSEITDKTTWTQDIAISHLAPPTQNLYHQNLLEIINDVQISLQATPKDGLCLFHSVATQLRITEPLLRASLLHHITHSQANIEQMIPAFSGEQFQVLVQELERGAWGDEKIAPLIALFYKKRVILIYPNSQTGSVNVSVFNPDGSGSNALPDDINNSDIIIVHNGQGHWLGANLNSGNGSSHNFQTHNQQLISGHETHKDESINRQLPSQVLSTNSTLFHLMTEISVTLSPYQKSENRTENGLHTYQFILDKHNAQNVIKRH